VKQQVLYRLYDNGILSMLDIHFASFIARLADKNVSGLSLAASLVSSYTRQGHVCLELSSVEGKELLKGEDGIDPVVCPELNNWCNNLEKLLWWEIPENTNHSFLMAARGFICFVTGSIKKNSQTQLGDAYMILVWVVVLAI
jgi:hypothetical protein